MQENFNKNMGHSEKKINYKCHNIDDNIPKNFKKISLQIQEAIKKNSNDLLSLSVTRTNQSSPVNAGELGKILYLFQEAVYALATKQTSNTRNVSLEIKQKSNLYFSSSKLAPHLVISFTSNTNDLFSRDAAEMYCNTLLKLIEYSNNPNTIIKKLENYNILTKLRLRNFLKHLDKYSFELEATWVNKFKCYNECKTNFHNTKASIKELNKFFPSESVEKTYTGKLVGIDIPSKFFAIVIDEGELIRGSLSKAIKEFDFKLQSNVEAKIAEQITISQLTKEEKTHYILNKLIVL